MIIYNVTVNIEDDVHDVWLEWMKQNHIPDVLATGKFTDARICKLLVDEQQGTTYTVQYTCDSMDDYNDYQSNHAPRLQKEHVNKFEGKFVAFRSIMKVV
jgi:hypothetical protein